MDIEQTLYSYRHLVEKVFARSTYFLANATKDDKFFVTP